MSENKDTILVCVYRDKKLIKQEVFTSLSSAHRLIENEVAMGHSCQMQRLENGRAWCTANYYPSESI